MPLSEPIDYTTLCLASTAEILFSPLGALILEIGIPSRFGMFIY